MDRTAIFVVSMVLLGAANLHARKTYAEAISAEAELDRVRLGEAVFRARWTPAGTPGSERSGVGPLFNAAACESCHMQGNGARRPASSEGVLPIALEIQLEAPTTEPDRARGDPVYGHVFNTAANAGVAAEGIATVRYREIDGYYYPDGTRWRMRVPEYRLTGLNYGPLASTTIIKPRLAPFLLGISLLEAVPQSAIGAATEARAIGRFGWQAESVSIRDQTTKALAREMGLTSTDRPGDDCTTAEIRCFTEPGASPPEVSEELVSAIVAFERTLKLQDSPMNGDDTSEGARLFKQIGCAACHRSSLPIELPGAGGTTLSGLIAPYTDLQLHDLGTGMADKNVAGTAGTSRWRTAPLWGLSHRLKTESDAALLHDGRARSVEEAILWHSGEGTGARYKFMNLWRRPREVLLRWLEGL